MVRVWKLAREDVEGFVDPFFGWDPYFDLEKTNKGLCYQDKETALKHVEYMFRFIWPLMWSYRQVLVAQKDWTTYVTLGMLAVGDRDIRKDGSMRLGAGHIFLSDYPGTGKTLLAKTPALVLGGKASRFQGLADALPADYTGNRMIQGHDPETGKIMFELIEGPGFSNFVILDEFPRASERTQGAVLESLGEGTITIFGKTYPVNSFAIVTANPVESAGVFSLSEAFLDRIMFKILGKPFTAEDFAEIARRTGEYYKLKFKELCQIEKVYEIREFFHKNIYVSPEIRKTMSEFAVITNNPHKYGFLGRFEKLFGDRVVKSGLSGRGFNHWEGAAKTLAAFRYRNYVTEEDAKKVILLILRHRLLFMPGVLRALTDELKFRDTTETTDEIIKTLIQEAW